MSRLKCSGQVFKHPASGFTLLETIVVLMLASVIATLLMQTLTFVLHTREQVIEHLDGIRTESLRYLWFNECLASVIPGYKDENTLFTGDAMNIRAHTVYRLAGDPGIPAIVNFALFHEGGELVLKYGEGDQFLWELGRWDTEDGAFSFLDGRGMWRSKWPPPDETLVSGRLPEMVLLSAAENNWLVKLRANKKPKPRLKDFLQ